jgi:quercetin dioxygenase-like cupin family protein
VTAGGIVRPATPAALRVLLSAAENDDALGVVEMAFPTGTSGPPLHLHPTHGEGFYVLSGVLTVQLGDRVDTVGQGGWAFAPAGTPHTLANLAAADARVLCVFAPGGFERRFERMLATDPEGAGLVDPTEAEAATRVLGPPLGPDAPLRP